MDTTPPEMARFDAARARIYPRRAMTRPAEKMFRMFILGCAHVA
jgi:hypothetical protein